MTLNQKGLSDAQRRLIAQKGQKVQQHQDYLKRLQGGARLVTSQKHTLVVRRKCELWGLEETADFIAHEGLEWYQRTRIAQVLRTYVPIFEEES